MEHSVLKNCLSHWEKSQPLLQKWGGDSGMLHLGWFPCLMSKELGRRVISGLLDVIYGLPLMVWNSILTPPYEHNVVRVIGAPVFSACHASALWVETGRKKGAFDILSTLAWNLASAAQQLESCPSWWDTMALDWDLGVDPVLLAKLLGMEFPSHWAGDLGKEQVMAQLPWTLVLIMI